MKRARAFIEKQIFKSSIVLAAVLILGCAEVREASAVRLSASAAFSTRATDIRVWMDDDMDVYPSEDGIVFNIRASYDCYATVYVVDTDGFIHVVYPLSPYDNAFINGGMVYRFAPSRQDIFCSSRQRGIAYVFAVASPEPFVYTSYDAGIFAGAGAFRIYGDPYIACKQFYLSLLPARVSLGLISVGFSHFYIREWAPYPRYIFCDYDYGFDLYRGEANIIYRSYRQHHNDPYRILRPGRPLPRHKAKYNRIARAGQMSGADVRRTVIRKTTETNRRSKSVTRSHGKRIKNSKTRLHTINSEHKSRRSASGIRRGISSKGKSSAHSKIRNRREHVVKKDSRRGKSRAKKSGR